MLVRALETAGAERHGVTKLTLRRHVHPPMAGHHTSPALAPSEIPAHAFVASGSRFASPLGTPLRAAHSIFDRQRAPE